MRIDSKTELYAVIGNPISQSLSPVMHNRAFETVGYNGAYLAFNVEDVGSAIAGVKGLGIKGVSVTHPHKVSIMSYLDEISEEAVKIGAVNTVVHKKDRLYGCNTDCQGAVKALSEKTGIRDKEVYLVGAGGAARAIGFGLISDGAHVTVLNRSKEKGERLAEDLGADFIPLAEERPYRCHILINTTPMGMLPKTESTPVKKRYIEKEMVVMDIVYNPLKTRFLREAEELGCVVIDGTGMFIHQGALQFELWTGKSAPIPVMRQAVMEALIND